MLEPSLSYNCLHRERRFRYGPQGTFRNLAVGFQRVRVFAFESDGVSSDTAVLHATEESRPSPANM